MKHKYLLFILIIALLLSACGAAEQVAVQETPAPAPVSTPEPTPEPTPESTPEPYPAFRELATVKLTTDSPDSFSTMYNGGIKGPEYQGTVALYEGDECLFEVPCCISMSGNSNLISSKKKNMNIKFRKKYEQKNLHYDVFGNGREKHSSLSLRAGQDSSFRIFNGEIWQDLCIDMSGSLLTQYSRFCILYVNGEYYGIYCLKDNISKGWYSDITGCEKEGLLDFTGKPEDPYDFYSDVYLPIKQKDMSVDENYEELCSVFDVDSFIDWAIIEGVSGNADLFANVRLFKAPESGKWQIVLFDLDSAMKFDAPWAAVFSDMQGTCYGNYITCNILNALLKNPEFRDKMLTRYAEVYDTVLSNESILEKAEYFTAILEPEIERDRAHWGFKVEDWEENVHSLYELVESTDWQNHALDRFCKYAHVTDEERDRYF